MSGIVPIYYGATNIENFIPKNCFIDYRKFKNFEEMYCYLENISENDYLIYLNNIKNYLKSEEAKLFSVESYVDSIYTIIKKIILKDKKC